MALAVIIILYVGIGLMSAAGSVVIVRRFFSARGEQIFFALFLIAIAGFYLAFTEHFGAEGARRLELAGVLAFGVVGLVGIRASTVLIIGYFVHGLWDVLHEMHAHGGMDLFRARQLTPIPLAYGTFCATYDWCMAAYFHTRRSDWRAAWGKRGRKSRGESFATPSTSIGQD